jgi:hypothetical protein
MIIQRQSPHHNDSFPLECAPISSQISNSPTAAIRGLFLAQPSQLALIMRSKWEKGRVPSASFFPIFGAIGGVVMM